MLRIRAAVSATNFEMNNMASTIPTSSGKTSLEDLKGIQEFEYSGLLQRPEISSRFKFQEEGLQFDFLWKPNQEHSRLFVLFSGDAIRAKNNPPVFQRWSWSSVFPGSCLFVSDPSLFLSPDLGLAWYSGTKKVDVLSVIARTVEAIAQQFSIQKSNIFSYGSSGGGFAALRLATFIPEIGVVTINPQTDIFEYFAPSVDRFLTHCFDGADRDFISQNYLHRVNLLPQATKLQKTRIIYLQNLVDTHHHKKHYVPFCKAIGVNSSPNEDSGLMRRILFSHEGGHTKAETPEAFTKAIEILLSY